jgi:hypothetical protein
VKINGLHVVLSKTDIMMDMKILEKPKETMALLMKMETSCFRQHVSFFIWPMVPLFTCKYYMVCNILFIWFLLLNNIFLPIFFPCKLVEGLKGQATLVSLSNNPSVHGHLEGVEIR